jgi:hypothetical protein
MAAIDSHRRPRRLRSGSRNETGGDVGDEPVTGLGNGLDAAAVAGAVTERLAEDGDSPAEIGLLDERVRPHRSDELVPPDEVARVLDKDLQDGEHLRGQRNDAPGPLEPLFRWVEGIRAERVDARALLMHGRPPTAHREMKELFPNVSEGLPRRARLAYRGPEQKSGALDHG